MPIDYERTLHFALRNPMSNACLDPDIPDAIRQHSLADARANYPHLIKIIDGLDQITRRFDYATTSQYVWKNFYVFPDIRSLSIDRFDNAVSDSRDVINVDEKSLTDWINSIAIDSVNSRDGNYSKTIRHFVSGETGCGKSTTIKRVLNGNRALFERSKLIPCRVEFSKIDRSGEKESKDNPTETLRRAVLDSMFREVCYFFTRSSPKILSFLSHSLFSSKFRTYVKNELLSSFRDQSERYDIALSKAESLIIKNFGRLNDFFRQARQQRNSTIWATSYPFKEIVCKYVYEELGHTFLLIFDGFDHITAADMLYETKNRRQIEALSDIQNSPVSYLLLREIYYPMHTQQIVIMRDATFARRMDRSPSLDESHLKYHYRVVSPSSRELTISALLRVAREIQIDLPADDLREITLFLRDEIKRLLVSKSYSIIGKRRRSVNVFNGNARLELYFIKNVLQFLLRVIIPAHSQNASFDAKDLVSCFNDSSVRRDIRTKGYRLFSILLCRNFERFRNSLVLPLGDSRRPSEIIDEEGVGNYIDNIYNYDETNTAPFALLAKIRLCELVSERSLTQSQIDVEMGEKYYTNLDRLICIMVKTGLLRVRLKQGTPRYQTEPVGELARRYLCTRIEYIEHIFPHTAIGPECRRHSERVYNRESSKPRHWSFCSLLNGYVFYQLVRQIELMERGEGKRWSWLADSIKANHKISLQKEVDSFGGIDGSFYGMISGRIADIE